MGNVIRNVVELLVISIMVVMGISTGLLLINDGGTDTEFLVDNQTFTTAASMDFSSVTIDSEYIKFNDTGFYIDSNNDISITISFICENSDKTSLDSFTVYANWDVNKDVMCDTLDLVEISNMYGSNGKNGWVRQDVDNNGVIRVLDLSIVSSFKDESYEV